MGQNVIYSCSYTTRVKTADRVKISSFLANKICSGALKHGKTSQYLADSLTVTEEKTTAQIFDLVGNWLTIPDIAELLDIKVTRVHSLIAERALLALRDPETQVRKVPELFFREEHVLESLKGTLIVLQDAGFSDEEAITWLFTEDESLPGRPIDALHQGRKTEIRRRASALAW